jgi:DNA-binding NtrC family response regulator
MIDSKPIRVLLVEDNPGDARLVQELLSEGIAAPAAVKHVASAADAMAALSSSAKSAGDAFDIVLLDLSMPDSQWLASFGQMQAVAPRVPIVVLTGIDDDDMALRSIREGAQDYLVKGDVTPQRLRRAIHLAIERNRLTLERPTKRKGK